MNKDFNYWAEEHYALKIVTGSKLDCMKVWKNDLQTYPSADYGTHIYARKFSENETTIIIKRFKTKELCEIHLRFPPTYARKNNTNSR